MKEEEPKIRPRHKKSFSAELFNIEVSNKFYDNFKNIKPPDDFIRTLQENSSEKWVVTNDDSSNFFPPQSSHRGSRKNNLQNLSKIFESGFDSWAIPKKFSLSELPNPNILMNFEGVQGLKNFFKKFGIH